MDSCKNIRQFQTNDFAKIAEIYALAKLDEFRFENDQFTLLPLAQDEKRLNGLMEAQIFVYDNGRVLGYGAVFRHEIRALFVHPLARGQGLGKSPLEYLLAEIVYPAHLYVVKSNAPAKALYQAYGFLVTRDFQTDYNGKSIVANEMVRIEPMAKSLP